MIIDVSYDADVSPDAGDLASGLFSQSKYCGCHRGVLHDSMGLSDALQMLSSPAGGGNGKWEIKASRQMYNPAIFALRQGYYILRRLPQVHQEVGRRISTLHCNHDND